MSAIFPKTYKDVKITKGIDLSIEIGTLKLKNPLMTASGCYEPLKTGFPNPILFGAVVLKTITLKPREGNPPPRIIEWGDGLVNSIGVQNMGIERFLEYLPQLQFIRKSDSLLIVSVMGTISELKEIGRILSKIDFFDAIELNLSCPNVQKDEIKRGIEIGQDQKLTYQAIEELKKNVNKPVWPKLTLSGVDVRKVAISAERAGADAVVIGNTIPCIPFDNQGNAILGNKIGGLSGKPLKSITLYWIEKVFPEITIPIIACGGISSYSDILAYKKVGAKAFQIGTALLTKPYSINEILSSFYND